MTGFSFAEPVAFAAAPQAAVAFGASRRAALTFAAAPQAAGLGGGFGAGFGRVCELVRGEETMARKAERKIGGEAVGGVVSRMRFGSA